MKMLALLLYLIGAGRLLALLLLAMAIAILQQRKPDEVGENRSAVVGPAPRDSLDRSFKLTR